MRDSALKNEVLASALVAALAAMFLIWSYSYTNLSGTFPKLVAWPTLLLALLDLGNRIRHWRSSGQDTDRAKEPSSVPLLDHVKVMLWPVGLVAAMYYIGFLLAIFLFTVLYMVVMGRNSLLRSFIISAFATVVIYVLFDIVFAANMPRGALFF